MHLNDFRSNQHSSKSSTSFISSFLKDLQSFLNNSIQFYAIDRIEGDFAVCENRKTSKMVNIPLKSLPKNISTNVILKFENGVYSVDYSKTIDAQNNIYKKSKNLWK